MTSVYLLRQGCAATQADSEYMQGLLKEARFALASTLEEADLVVCTTCRTRESSEDFFRRLEELQAQYPYKILVGAGCFSLNDKHKEKQKEKQKDKQKLKRYPLIATLQIHRIVEVVEEALHNNCIQALENEGMPPLHLPKVRKSPLIEIIPIGRGCLGTRASYPLEEIVEQAKRALAEGVKEIFLTSPDTLGYGFEMGTNLARLLKELIALSGDFKIRMGKGSPSSLNSFFPEFLPLLAQEKIFRFLHLSAFSGSTRVLRELKRGHTAQEYIEMVQEIRKVVSDFHLVADILVGFPTETEEDHWETLNLLRKTTPDEVHLVQFRGMTALPAEVLAHRTKVLTDLSHNLASLQNERWKQWEGNILIEESGPEPGQWIGRNLSYKPIRVEGNFKLGDVVKVQIEKTTREELKGIAR